MLRGLVSALVAVNVVMFLVFVGAAGSTRQALEMLGPGAVASCATAAGVTAPAAAEIVGHDTIRFRARERDDDGDGAMVTVSCTLDDDGPVDVEVAR